MSIEIWKWVGIAFFFLAGVRGFLHIRHEGSLRFFLILVLGIAAWWLGTRWSPGTFLIVLLGVLSLLVIARPSRHVRLTRRVQTVVAQLTDGLGVEIEVGVIPMDHMREDLSSNGLDTSMAGLIINACAGRKDGLSFILFTPGAAALSTDELSFIAAHEIGHHVLGHTREGFFDKVGKMLTSGLGLAMTMGISTLWKHFVVPRRSQSQEYEADAWAVSRLQNLGLGAAGGLQVMDRFIEIESQTFLARLQTKLFGDHPSAYDRKAKILNRI